MNVVILGAGSIGSIWAGRMIDAGHNVTVVARNKRLQDLQSKGLRLKPQYGSAIETYAVNAIAELTPDVVADVILVTVQRHQLDALMPALMAQSCPRIVFMFNCGEDDSVWQKQLQGRMVWGFPAALGGMQDDVVEYVVLPGSLSFLQVTTVGINAGGSMSIAADINALFNGAKIASVLHSDMRSWLATHMALMLPLMAVGVRKIKNSQAVVMSFAEAQLMARAQQEAFSLVRSASMQVTPVNLRLLGLVPAAVVAPFLWFGFKTTVMRKALVGHADHAYGEVLAMYADYKKIAGKAGRPTPYMDKLFDGL